MLISFENRNAISMMYRNFVSLNKVQPKKTYEPHWHSYTLWTRYSCSQLATPSETRDSCSLWCCYTLKPEIFVHSDVATPFETRRTSVLETPWTFLPRKRTGMSSGWTGMDFLRCFLGKGINLSFITRGNRYVWVGKGSHCPYIVPVG